MAVSRPGFDPGSLKPLPWRPTLIASGFRDSLAPTEPIFPFLSILESVYLKI